MTSPYSAPASTFVNEAITAGSLRWHGAFYFAFLPTVFTIVAQCSEIYSASRYGLILWHLKMLEPLLYCAPFCLLMGATGYTVAIRCLSGTISRTLLAGCVTGAGWVLVTIVVGNTIAQLTGATPITVDRVIRMLVVISVIFVPLAVVLCIFTRRRGVRLGFVISQA
ncbi:hypothetical protein IV454_21075 [Massilia antarctica]|uniref:Uncharacterized protein n=1 Tax=Massilia antarctica TaxID=2765360 RepID=A0AA49A6Z6_9BURK|nr:hypothetical protein [Massilia antarctica]QPI48035.1 hypothetical protein IV454_21075 [Massilia antarctica]